MPSTINSSAPARCSCGIYAGRNVGWNTVGPLPGEAVKYRTAARGIEVAAQQDWISTQHFDHPFRGVALEAGWLTSFSPGKVRRRNWSVEGVWMRAGHERPHTELLQTGPRPMSD